MGALGEHSVQEDIVGMEIQGFRNTLQYNHRTINWDGSTVMARENHFYKQRVKEATCIYIKKFAKQMCMPVCTHTLMPVCCNW